MGIEEKWATTQNFIVTSMQILSFFLPNPYIQWRREDRPGVVEPKPESKEYGESIRRHLGGGGSGERRPFRRMAGSRGPAGREGIGEQLWHASAEFEFLFNVWGLGALTGRKQMAQSRRSN